MCDHIVLCVGSSSGRLISISALVPFSTPSILVIDYATGNMTAMDAIVFDASKSTLFIVGNGVNSLFAVTSDDQWMGHAIVRSISDTNCPNGQPSALAIVANLHVCVYCTNGFGDAPYPITILQNAIGTRMPTYDV